MHTSMVKELGRVTFPPFTGERVYMRRFTKQEGLPEDLRRWQPTVDAMLERVDTDGPIYLMVDQAEVAAGAPHRRPGMHVDGYWLESANGHSGHSAHGGGGPRHQIWENCDFSQKEAVILASDAQAARAFVGEWQGPIGEGGDCIDVSVDTLLEIPMLENTIYAGNVTMLHESLPVARDCRRTLVRLNVPGWHP